MPEILLQLQRAGCPSFGADEAQKELGASREGRNPARSDSSISHNGNRRCLLQTAAGGNPACA